jgi:hypothetical protein
MITNDEIITVRVPKGYRDQMMQAAKKRRISFSAIVRLAIKALLGL